MNEGAGLVGVGAIILVDETGTTAEYGADPGIQTSSGVILPSRAANLLCAIARAPAL